MGKKSRLKKEAAKPNIRNQQAEPREKITHKRFPWHIIILGLIMIVGCYLRMYYINANDYEKKLFFPGKGIGFGNEELLGWDGVRYDWIATNVIEGNGYGYKPGQPDAWRPPGYPFFLIAVYFIFGKNYYTVRVIQVLLSVVSILFSYLIARHIAGKSAGLTAALISALYFDAVVFPLLYYSEILFMFFISILIYMLINFSRYDNRGRCWKWVYPVCIGLIGGCATLVRPIYLLSYPCIILGLLWYHKFNRTTMVKVAVMTIALLIVLMPWSIRNSMLKGKPTFISTNGGLNFAMGFCENANGLFLPETKRFTPEEKEIIKDRGYGAVVTHFVTSHPFRAVQLYLKKIWQQLYKHSARTKIKKFTNCSIPMLAYTPWIMLMFGGGLLASILGKKRKRFAVIYGYLAGYMFASAFFFFMGDRHRIPLLPVYAIFGGYLVSVVYSYVKRYFVAK